MVRVSVAVESVERLLREAVFTTVNRLLAVRVAEAVGVLPPSLVDGRASVGFVEAVEVFPLVRDADPSGGYWSYLQVCGDELSHAVPRLFDRRQPLSVLEPSAEALDAAVGVLADPELVGVWVEPEALGWSYQFFNTQEERRAMRDASSASLGILVSWRFGISSSRRRMWWSFWWRTRWVVV